MIPTEQGRKDSSWGITVLTGSWYNKCGMGRDQKSNFQRMIWSPYIWNVLYLGFGMADLVHAQKGPGPVGTWQACTITVLQQPHTRSGERSLGKTERPNPDLAHFPTELV